MAHFAKLNEKNIVIDVVVVNNNLLLNKENIEQESIGVDFLNKTFGEANWVQTSYNSNIRKNFAGIGYKYDASKDAFIPPKPFGSWILNEDTCLWDPPVQKPDQDNLYKWNEASLSWHLIHI